MQGNVYQGLEKRGLHILIQQQQRRISVICPEKIQVCVA